uniref:Uncharacterized protein n=1 Tax=Acanthochromis polyacanthus TaxID=80966 RepID=A0A3Q1GF95_9TELE
MIFLHRSTTAWTPTRLKPPCVLGFRFSYSYIFCGLMFPPVFVGVVSAVLLLLICVITVSLWCLSRHKGSYVTNETDDDDDIDDESVGSDTALQSKEPLKKDDEE